MGQQQNMLDWNEYRKELTGKLGEFSERNPTTMESDKALTTAGKKIGYLDAKTRDLIAIALRDHALCPLPTPWMRWAKRECWTNKP